MKQIYTIFFIAILAFFSTNNLFACDTTPVVSASNVQNIGGGLYTVDVQVCIGTDGSQFGFDVTISGGLSITATSPTSLNNGGRIANSSISGGVLDYTYGGAGWWEPDDGISGPCFNFTITVNGNPSGQTLTFTGINDNCQIISSSWTANIPGPCIVDYSVVGVGSYAGSTVGAGNNCTLRASQDEMFEIQLPCNGSWTFETCSGASWDTYLFIGNSCCTSFSQNDDACGLQSRVTFTGGPTTVYVDVEAFSSSTTGSYTLFVTGPACAPLNGSMVSSFDGELLNGTAIVTWEVQNEINVESYEVERALPGGDFQYMGSVSAKGMSGEGASQYKFEDAGLPDADKYYYRITINGKDGLKAQSSIVELSYEGIITPSVSPFYPNPTQGVSSVQIDAVSPGEVVFRFMDAAGRLIHEDVKAVSRGVNQVDVDTSELPAGMYYVSVLVNGSQETIKLVKM